MWCMRRKVGVQSATCSILPVLATTAPRTGGTQPVRTTRVCACGERDMVEMVGMHAFSFSFSFSFSFAR